VKSEYCAVLHLSEIEWSKRKDHDVAQHLVKLFVHRLEAALRGDRHKAAAIAARQKAKKEAAAKGKRLGWTHFKPKKGRRPGVLSDEDNRLVRTLINGIQRAMPYLDTTADSTAVNEETTNALFKVCHTVSAFSTRIAILSLLFRCLFERMRGEPPDRFYRLMYEQIAQFDLFTSAHRHQATLLLQRCIPADASVGRAVAMCRRMLQVGSNAQPPVAVAALTVLRELLMARRAEVRPLLNSVDADLKAAGVVGDDDDDEEHFVDDDASAAAPGAGDDEAAAAADKEKYAPHARDPRHSKSRQTPLWELYALRSHVHPFVAHSATQLLEAGSFEDVGKNVFETFSQSEMLEQFVLSSRANRDSKDRRKDPKDKQSKTRMSFTTERFSKKKNVLPHERFFQLYFKDETVQKLQRQKEQSKKQKEEDFDEEGGKSGEEASEVDEEEEDKFFDEYLQGQMPGADDDEDEDDPDMDDDSDDDEEGGDEDDANFDDDPLRNEGDEPEDGSGDDDDGEEEAEAPPARKSRKRKASEDAAEEEPATKGDRIKQLRKLHAKSSFASVEDFEGLLDDDGAED